MTDEHAEGRAGFEVFVSVRPPEHWQRIEDSGQPHPGALAARQRGKTWRRPDIASDDLDWQGLGLAPRFVGTETTACVAALEPSIFHNEGIDELRRYLAAAEARGETALLVSMIGDPDEDAGFRSVLFSHDAHVSLLDDDGSVGGRRLPVGARGQVADGLSSADRDLALRLCNRPEPAYWWKLELQGPSVGARYDDEPSPPVGELHPLVTNDIGEVLAAVWLPGCGRNLRWYLVPGGSDWKTILSWLADRAIPEYAPDALRRARSPELVDDELLTADELATRDAIRRFDEDAVQVRSQLAVAADAARSAAHTIRLGLLYGKGANLVAPVSRVLGDAGFDVEDLDSTLGSSQSADLLASRHGRHWLIEVRSVSGNAAENAMEDLERHLRTWPTLGRQEQLDGGVLVINHQHSRAPLQRDPAPYTRAAFVDSLTHPVIPTLALFAWWRDSNHAAVVGAVTGPARCHRADLTRTGGPSPEREPAPVPAPASATQPRPTDQQKRRRRWGRG
jgi:hypothetical protein